MKMIDKLTREIRDLEHKLWKYESTLELIATPARPDGTYNYSREGCEQLAKKVLGKK